MTSLNPPACAVSHLEPN